MIHLEVIEQTEQLTHVALVGQFDIEGVQEIGGELESATAGRGRNTVLDLSRLEFMASLGIGTLMSIAKGLRTQGAELVLVQPRPLVDRTLRVAQIDRILPIVPSREQAMLRFSGSASR